GLPDTDSKPDKPNEEFARKATDLTLETFRKQMEEGKIDKDVLKKMNWTEKDLKDFMDQYKKFKEQGGTIPKDAVGKSTGNKANLKSTGPAESVTRTGKAMDAQADPGLQPPPELRNSFEEFTRQLSKPRKK